MGTKIVVVDDDPLVGELTTTLLQDAGLETLLINSSVKALEIIKTDPPAMAILDILMPGIDGLTLCHRLKSDPATKGIKVVMVSGKSFQADRKRAKDYGADAFIEKPYNVDTFAARIQELLAGKAVAPDTAPAADAAMPEGKLSIAIRGCRSLSPSQGGAASRYGRETSCVTLQIADHLFILDAGSGIVPLGKELTSAGQPKELRLLLTHFHEDHVEGLGLFAPAYAPGFKLIIAGASDPDQSLEAHVQRIFETAPAELGELKAELELYEMREETYQILPGVKVSPFFANHPGMTLGFIVEAEGRKFVYSPDAEIYGEQGTALQDYDERLVRLVEGADLLIHDGRYLDADYQTHKNNGHSSWLNTVELALRAEVKSLVLVHHDDAYSDEILDRIESEARALIAQKGSSMQFAMGREGLKVGI